MNWALNTEILERAKQQGCTPRQAAFKMARSRVEEAMSYRRYLRKTGRRDREVRSQKIGGSHRDEFAQAEFEQPVERFRDHQPSSSDHRSLRRLAGEVGES